MRLVRAELLKIRRRQATYVTFIVALALMGVTFLIAGFGFKFDGLIEFPDVYGLTGQFAYGLGGLLAVVYSAAFMGADWNWGVLRNVVARGESRAGYLLAKAAALAIVLGIALVILYLFGIVMAYVTGWIHGVPVASPLRGRGLLDLIDNLALGYPVLIQRAALGFAVAVVVRSQIAGAVVGILLFLGESIVKFTLLGASLPGRMGDVFGEGGLQPIGPEWYQYLPVSVGDYVIGAAPGGGGGLTSFLESFLIRPVPIEQAMLSVLIYLALALGLSIVALNRQEIA
jgi:ABC-type transport system involved in multi-copper enzyme maturation permease subunit